MALSDIAAGLVVVDEQDDRGVATVDDTGVGLAERFAAHADALPCTPEAAATVVETYGRGVSVGDSARAAGVAPMTAAKALHRCGVPGVSPLAPTARRVVRDWVAGHLSRADALELTGGDDAAFALAGYVETHDPVPALAEATDAALDRRGDASVAKREALAETMSAATDLR
ncbi:hypothetical protein [Halobaculum sp. D14]|uniref:DUF7858 family protein n=1 Tax=unclassified Halobaculum TaxID=2640896 RepID=UPI003EBEDEE4